MVAAPRTTEVDYEFVAMEDTVSYMPVEDLIRMLFTPFKAEFRSRGRASTRDSLSSYMRLPTRIMKSR